MSEGQNKGFLSGVTGTVGGAAKGVTDTAGNAGTPSEADSCTSMHQILTSLPVSGLGNVVGDTTKGLTGTVGDTTKGVGNTAKSGVDSAGNMAGGATGGSSDSSDKKQSAQNPLGL